MSYVALASLLASFTLDLSGLLDYAEDIFNGLVGAYVPIWGIILGFGILAAVGAFIMKAVSRKA